MAQLILFGAIHKITGEYVYPKIANKQDEYICPTCGKDLILCQGNIRVHHFRHKVDALNPCHHYSHPSEGDVHKEAKILLKNLLERRIPISFVRTYCSCNEDDDEIINVPAFDNNSQIKLEHRFYHNGNLKIADVAFIRDDELLFIFEIYNTHKTDENHRPEPWVEINAVTLINQVNDNGAELLSLQIPCIRTNKCNKCLLLDIKTCDINKYVRIKLGQNIFTVEQDMRPSHLRIDWGKRCDNVQHNKDICELFNDDTINYKIIIHTHKGSGEAIIVLNSDYTKYNYWDYTICYDNNGLCKLPSETIIPIVCDELGTVNILVKCIRYCQNRRYSVQHFNVPYAKKDKAKQLGFKWDSEHKKWYIDASHKNYENACDIYTKFTIQPTIIKPGTIKIIGTPWTSAYPGDEI